MEKFNADLDDYRTKTVQSMITLAGKVVAVTGMALQIPSQINVSDAN